MSVFDGDIEYKSVYRNDFIELPPIPLTRPHPDDDNCMIIGISRDSLRVRQQAPLPDVLCPLDPEDYKRIVNKIKKEHPTIASCTRYRLDRDVEPTLVENANQDLKRTEYLVEYCPRDLPFMSINLTRRAKALQTLHLPDDVIIPDTVYTGGFRHPPAEKYVTHSSAFSMRPKYEPELPAQLRKILRVTTGETYYQITHNLLGKVVLKKNPFGPPREEPKYGKWKTRYLSYTYRL